MPWHEPFNPPRNEQIRFLDRGFLWFHPRFKPGSACLDAWQGQAISWGYTGKEDDPANENF
jgi:hypothetical protein